MKKGILIIGIIFGILILIVAGFFVYVAYYSRTGHSCQIEADCLDMACPGNSKINLENRAKSFNVIYPTKWHLNCEAAEECMEEVRELMEQNADAIDIFNHCNDRKVCKCYPMFIQM